MPGLRIVTLAGAESSLDETQVEELGSRLRGELLRSVDAGYEEARLLWNGVIDGPRSSSAAPPSRTWSRP